MGTDCFIVDEQTKDYENLDRFYCFKDTFPKNARTLPRFLFLLQLEAQQKYYSRMLYWTKVATDFINTHPGDVFSLYPDYDMPEEYFGLYKYGTKTIT